MSETTRVRRRPINAPEPLRLGPPITEGKILLMANWVKDTTLMYGGSISTAFTVAGIMARGLEGEMLKQFPGPHPAPSGPEEAS